MTAEQHIGYKHTLYNQGRSQLGHTQPHGLMAFDRVLCTVYSASSSVSEHWEWTVLTRRALGDSHLPTVLSFPSKGK